MPLGVRARRWDMPCNSRRRCALGCHRSMGSIERSAPSAVLWSNRKWIGPMWSDIQPGIIFKIRPTKTERTTGKEVMLDLSEMPMVLEEIARVPEADRHGPLVINRRAVAHIW